MLVYGFLDGFYFILIIWSRSICRILYGIQRIEMEGIPNEKLTKAKINLLLLEIYDDQASNLNRPKSLIPCNRCPINL